MKFRRALWILTTALLVGATTAFALGPARDIPIGTGYSALELCTRTMQSGESPEHVIAHYLKPKVRPLPAIWEIDYEPGRRVEVRTKVPLLHQPGAAVFRPGWGCTVLPPGVNEAELRAQPFSPAPELPDDMRPWPLGEGDPESALLDSRQRAIIDRHADAMFLESDDPSHDQHTTAFLVARARHLVYERYGERYRRNQPQIGWSMTKSLTAILTGLLVKDAVITLDSSLGLSQWRGTPKEAITWRHLLNMAAGLAWFEGYGGASDATEMLFLQANQGAWAADRGLIAEPGSTFTYSTGVSNIIALRLFQLLGNNHQAFYDFYERRLFAPLGIRHGMIEADASGIPIGGARGLLRAVDWLRLGQLIIDGGLWNGESLLTPEYVAFMAAPSPASSAYGGSLWRVTSDMIPPDVRARLPNDLVWFAGHLGQFTIVVPSQQLVVVRMGVAADGVQVRQHVFSAVADLLAAGPASQTLQP
jgi:CubicO group peptidase (beta-lactamase class C family)